MSSHQSSSSDSLEIESYKASEVHLDSKQSNSEESSQVINAELFVGGEEGVKSPYDFIFKGRSVLSLETLLEDADAENTPTGNNCCRFFCCFRKKNRNVKFSRDKVLILASLSFDRTLELHGNVVLTWYSEVTGNQSFRLEQNIWQRLGFNNDDLKTNGFQEPGIIICLLHLIFLKKRFPGILSQFWSCCLNPNALGNLISANLTILKTTKELFDTNQSISHLSRSSETALSSFFLLQTGLVVLWCRSFEESLVKSNYDLILRSARIKSRRFSEIMEIPQSFN
jgi:hypothetical protein